MRGTRRGDRSRVEVRDQLALEPHDLVLEHQLALLEAPQLQLVDVDVEREPADHVVEVAVLDPELAQALHAREQLGVDLFFVGHAGRKSDHTGRMEGGSLANRPGGFHGTAGSWKSEPTDPSSPQRTASEIACSRSRGLPPPVTTSTPRPPAAANSEHISRRAPAASG